MKKWFFLDYNKKQKTLDDAIVGGRGTNKKLILIISIFLILIIFIIPGNQNIKLKSYISDFIKNFNSNSGVSIRHNSIYKQKIIEEIESQISR